MNLRGRGKSQTIGIDFGCSDRAVVAQVHKHKGAPKITHVWVDECPSDEVVERMCEWRQPKRKT